jgi:transposase
MKFVATKTADQLDLQALHRVRARLVSQRTGIINQIRAFLLERGIAVRQGLRFLRAQLPEVLSKRTDVLCDRMVHVIEDLAADWRRLDERIQGLSGEIEIVASQDPSCASSIGHTEDIRFIMSLPSSFLVVDISPEREFGARVIAERTLSDRVRRTILW